MLPSPSQRRKCESPLIAGLVIGVLESLSIYVLPSEYEPMIAFVVLLIVLVVRPGGLFQTEVSF
jgi:branched-subunit amino acid ABC-type transport system permease component